MNIIALEGLDKSGKATQAKLLFHRMECNQIICEKSEFHRYDTPTGKLIREFLFNTFKVNQYTIELIMAADKQMQQNWFKELINQDVKFLILDRYTSSQEAYAWGNGIPIEWIKDLHRYLMKPSLEIFIDIPVEESMNRKGKMPTDDKYETNKELLQSVRDRYDFMFRNEFAMTSNRYVVDGMQSIESVHYDIWNICKKFYNF